MISKNLTYEDLFEDNKAITPSDVAEIHYSWRAGWLNATCQMIGLPCLTDLNECRLLASLET